VLNALGIAALVIAVAARIAATVAISRGPDEARAAADRAAAAWE
jgi:hypothetical protein